eukprot:10053323-Prorocentrum_lima.AAC.1
MTSSLVGSEMCIRDRPCRRRTSPCTSSSTRLGHGAGAWATCPRATRWTCLLYTSDAADDM